MKDGLLTLLGLIISSIALFALLISVKIFTDSEFVMYAVVTSVFYLLAWWKGMLRNGLEGIIVFGLIPAFNAIVLYALLTIMINDKLGGNIRAFYTRGKNDKGKI